MILHVIVNVTIVRNQPPVTGSDAGFGVVCNWNAGYCQYDPSHANKALWAASSTQEVQTCSPFLKVNKDMTLYRIEAHLGRRSIVWARTGVARNAPDVVNASLRLRLLQMIRLLQCLIIHMSIINATSCNASYFTAKSQQATSDAARLKHNKLYRPLYCYQIKSSCHTLYMIRFIITYKLCDWGDPLETPRGL